MSRANLQPQQAERGSPAPALRKEQAANIQIEIGRAFEVATAIEKAIRAESGESLEGFVGRLLSKLFERREETCLKISRIKDFRDFGDIQVYLDADGNFPSGKSLSVNIWVSSHEESQRACDLIPSTGFMPNKGNMNVGFVCVKPQDVSRSEQPLATSMICSILKNLWDISAKDKIVCYFDHEVEASERGLTSDKDLKSCLAVVSSREPISTNLVLTDRQKNLGLAIRSRGKGRYLVVVPISTMDVRRKSEIKQLFAVAGYEQDQDYEGEEGWLGRDDLNFVIPLLLNILGVFGARLESGKLLSRLILKHRFS